MRTSPKAKVTECLLSIRCPTFALAELGFQQSYLVLKFSDAPLQSSNLACVGGSNPLADLVGLQHQVSAFCFEALLDLGHEAVMLRLADPVSRWRGGGVLWMQASPGGQMLTYVAEAAAGDALNGANARSLAIGG